MSGTLEQYGQSANVVGAKHDIHPRCTLLDGVAVLLRQATTDSDLHTRVAFLDVSQHAEIAVKLIVGVLPDGAGVEYHNVRNGVTITVKNSCWTGFLDCHHACGLQQARHTL